MDLQAALPNIRAKHFGSTRCRGLGSNSKAMKRINCINLSCVAMALLFRPGYIGITWIFKQHCQTSEPSTPAGHVVEA